MRFTEEVLALHPSVEDVFIETEMVLGGATMVRVIDHNRVVCSERMKPSRFEMFDEMVLVQDGWGYYGPWRTSHGVRTLSHGGTLFWRRFT